MSLRIASCVIIFVLAPLTTAAQDHGLGLGILLGEPTGLSGKAWVSEKNAVDAGMAWSFRSSGFFHVHADYLWHFPLRDAEVQRFTAYAGVGGRLGIRSRDALLGVRIVGGLAYWPRGTPLDLFVEVAPILDLTPATEMSANGGIGIRFFFQ
jgi:hypothetical protein